MAVKAVFFDFDGTIADTYDAFVKIVNRLSDEFGYQPVTPDELEQLKNLSSREIIKKARISAIKIPFLLRRVQTELNAEVQFLKPIKDIEAALQHLKKQGYLLGIITSNALDNVRLFLVINHLDHLFDFIYSGTPLFGKHRAIAKLLKRHHLKPEEVIYVGDETRDIHSAKKSNVRIIAVGWGFNSAEILAQHQPDYLVYQPSELIATIDNCDRPLQQALPSPS